jgi:DNA-directed RNA polymerase sigma subunit (sigma70/sigma32)
MLALEKSKVATRDLVCAKCGVDAACDCGVAPIDRAKYELLQNPENSNRAIAEAAGTTHRTVAKARTQLGTSTQLEKRVGKDGKARKMPKLRAADDTASTTSTFDRQSVLTEIDSVLQDSNKRVLEILRRELGVAGALSTIRGALN